jgi:preprotein translocase subunit Sec61beta
MSFYDAPTKGPKFNPKVVLALVFIFALIILVANHFILG